MKFMKLIIFDIDGTLTDSVNIDDAKYLEALEELFDIKFSDADWLRFKNISSGTDSGVTYAIFKELFDRYPTESEYERLKNLFVSKLSGAVQIDKSSIKPIPGSVEFINDLAIRNDVIIGIATGSWAESGIIKLNAIGLNAENYIYSNASLYMNRSEIINHVIESANSDFKGKISKKPVYFGDGEWDYKATRELSIDLIGIDFYNTGALKILGVDKVISDYLEIDDILRGLIA